MITCIKGGMAMTDYYEKADINIYRALEDIEYYENVWRFPIERLWDILTLIGKRLNQTDGFGDLGEMTVIKQRVAILDRSEKKVGGYTISIRVVKDEE